MPALAKARGELPFELDGSGNAERRGVKLPIGVGALRIARVLTEASIIELVR